MTAREAEEEKERRRRPSARQAGRRGGAGRGGGGSGPRAQATHGRTDGRVTDRPRGPKAPPAGTAFWPRPSAEPINRRSRPPPRSASEQGGRRGGGGPPFLGGSLPGVPPVGPAAAARKGSPEQRPRSPAPPRAASEERQAAGRPVWRRGCGWTGLPPEREAVRPGGAMYRKEKSLVLKDSSLALYNNLSVLPLPSKQLTYLACVHGSTVNLVSASDDGQGFSHRQLQAKESSLGMGASIITQAAWCVLPSRILLVLTSRKGVQMYESDGSVMVYWHALDGLESSAGNAAFARGIAATGRGFICVGISSGCILVFDVPSKGTNITLSEVLGKHRAAITDMGAESCAQPEGSADLVTADDVGALCVWRSGERFELISQVPASECPCSSVKLWKGIVAAGYGNGQIRLYEATSGVLRAEVSAHARWIYALDVAPESGKLLSAAEDSFVQVWKLSHHLDTQAVQIEHCHGECVTDTLLCGARFYNPEGTAFAVTGFELSEILRYAQA